MRRLAELARQGGRRGDVIDGGGGSDTIHFTSSYGAVLVSLRTGVSFWNYAEGDFYANVWRAAPAATRPAPSEANRPPRPLAALRMDTGFATWIRFLLPSGNTL